MDNIAGTEVFKHFIGIIPVATTRPIRRIDFECYENAINEAVRRFRKFYSERFDQRIATTRKKPYAILEYSKDGQLNSVYIRIKYFGCNYAQRYSIEF